MNSGASRLLTALAVAALAVGLAADALAAANPQPKKKKPKKKVVKFAKYEAGLADAKGKSKPVVLVFADKRYKGPAIFEGDALFKALTDSGAVPVRLSQPVLRIPKKADDAKRKKLQEQFTADQKQYRELAAKFGVNAMPTVVFLSPEGERMCSLVRPNEAQVRGYLANLGKILEQFKAAKAAGGGGKPAEAPKAEEKKADDAKKGGAAK